jgi:pantothenate kinase type III
MKTKDIKKKQTVLYQVEPISSEEQLEILFDENIKHQIVKQELDNVIVVSVPSSMTHNSAQQLMEKFPIEWKDRPVMIITDNIKFFRCKRIRTKDHIKLYKND